MNPPKIHKKIPLFNDTAPRRGTPLSCVERVAP